MITMYPPQNNSPKAHLVDPINEAATQITVDDASILPKAPNLATLGTEEDAEVVLYTQKNENILAIVRGFNGTTPKAWEAGTSVYRAIMAYDIEALQKNVLDASGEDGATFIPSVSDEGDLSWTNDKGLENPETKNIRGPQGPVGKAAEINTTAFADAWGDVWPYTQVVDAPGVTADSQLTVGLNNALVAADDYAIVTAAQLRAVDSAADTVTMEALGTVPTIDIPIIVRDYGVPEPEEPELVVIDLPEPTGSLTYTGGVQSPTWLGYDTATMSIGGTSTATNAGTYYATFTPYDGYMWADGTQTEKSVPWSIGRATVSSIPTQSGSLTYNGSAQSPAWDDYDTTKLTIGGTTSSTNAGSFNATFTPTANYQWFDGTIAAKNAAWSIGRATVASVPTQSGSLTYNGNSQSPTWNNYDATELAIGGTTSSTNAGTFNATFTPTANYQWFDGTIAAKNAAWSIGKAAGSLSIDKTSVTLNSTATTANITVTRAGDGAISAVSSNTGVATVSVTGNTVTVFSVDSTGGEAIVTISVAEGTNHTAPASKSVAVVATFVTANIFGVSWGRTSSPTLTRLTSTTDPFLLVNVDVTGEPSPAIGTSSGSSPFDAYAPWNGMGEYNIIDGTVAYKKGDAGFSRTAYDTMVYIPEFYYKVVDNGGKLYYYIADGAAAGFEKHLGSGRYVSRYMAANDYTFRSNIQPVMGDINGFRQSITAKGAGWHLFDFATLCAIQLLFLVEFATWNSQAAVGLGMYFNSDYTGLTDSLIYDTGCTEPNADNEAHVQYRGIEDPWLFYYSWVDGINVNNGAVYISTDPESYATDTTTGYTAPGVVLPSTDGYITDFKVSTEFPWAFLPIATGGSAETYVTDAISVDTGWCSVLAGYTAVSAMEQPGLWALDVTTTDAGNSISARGIFIPE